MLLPGALPGLQNGYEGVGEEKLFEENNKKFDVLAGIIWHEFSSIANSNIKQANLSLYIQLFVLLYIVFR
jgi:hypothetical protein